MDWVTRALKQLPVRGDFLDMGTGRGELLDIAKALGYGPVIMGTETVPALIDNKRVVEGYAHSLPFEDKQFRISACIDVLEHILPGDDEAAVKNLARVTREYLLISANNRPSKAWHEGEDLHINIRPYEEWQMLILQWSGGASIKQYRKWPGCSSAMWLVRL